MALQNKLSYISRKRFETITMLTRFFSLITKDELFLKILGGIVKVGNCLNAGNKQRGQADGFLLDSLSKANMIKDKN